MGTFRIRSVDVTSQSGWGAYDVGAGRVVGVPSNAQLITIVNQFPHASSSLVVDTNANIGSYETVLIPDAAGIFLDGSGSAISENSLPIGFVISSALLTCEFGEDGDFSATENLKIGATVGVTGVLTLAYPTSPTLTLNGLLAYPYGGIYSPTATSRVYLGGVSITGVYNTVSFSWGLNNGLPFNVPSTSPVIIGKLYGPAVGGVGERFQIQSGSIISGMGGDLTNIYSTATPTKTGVDLKGTFGAGSGAGISSVIFSWNVAGVPSSVTVTSGSFDEWTSIFISFLLPNTLPENTLIDVNVISSAFPAIPAPSGTGTQFSGSVKLGVLKILTTAASGIYRIIEDKTDDTVYINSPTDDTTAEVKIPYPHIKTGFIGG